ncbi:outer membrane beta-barrel protein [Edaphobacter flagellatus]|uniref:outer membrane beta-barrel protein n=1 Tax=Edaphobacter flagellatus TaxID=1933044 RepID=UPI0021B3DDC5|nr:outer membrane beta-barrel protein [Edaphobacter flagellatus]
MSNVSRLLLARSFVLCLFASLVAPAVHAQATTGNSTLDRHLSRLDLGISGFGAITKSVSGINERDHLKVDQNASTTVGALVTIRYTKSPWLGGEFNYGYARYTENFTNATNASIPNQYITGGVQTNANEYSLGYVAHPPRLLLSAHPFIAVGAGSTAFRPTTGGGQKLPEQARMTYYYAVGAEQNVFNDHFGLRIQLRQTFFKAPDFQANYLRIQQQTWTIEPAAGFFLRF